MKNELNSKQENVEASTPQIPQHQLKLILEKEGLTNREIEVVCNVIKGLSNHEVAFNLCVTETTIKFHLTNIFRKIGVKKRERLIAWCLPHMMFK